MEVKFKFSNGEEVKDVVSGFTGIIDCSSIWLNGCIRYSIQPKMKEGETSKPDSIWMDEENLQKISDGVKKAIKPSPTGGPSFGSDSARR
jgi:hypothetical protein